MPTLSQRSDCCYIIRGNLFNNDDEDQRCFTWQVDDARSTIRFLNDRGINTSILPARFPVTYLIGLNAEG